MIDICEAAIPLLAGNRKRTVMEQMLVGQSTKDFGPDRKDAIKEVVVHRKAYLTSCMILVLITLWRLSMIRHGASMDI